MRNLLTFLLALLCCTSGAMAEPANSQQADIDTMLALASQAKLAEQVEWRKMLLYHHSMGGWVSRVDDPTYFLAADGKHNPQAELEATIRNAYTEAQAENSPQPVLCRYIARYQYLSRQMKALGFEYRAPYCATYEQWRANISTYRATLVFAAIYLNSPASMYGHTFIRFDSAKRGSFNRLNDTTVGYSVGSMSQGDPLFLFKSLVGGYPGEFTYAAFFKKVREYSDLESRDIWEYETNLDEAEIRRMLAFVWEQSFTYANYYFFDDNCSFMLLAAFEAARPTLNLTEQTKPWFIPLDAVKTVNSQPGLVTQVRFRPSQFNNTQFNFYRADSGVRDDAVALLDEQQQESVLARYPDDARRADLLDLTLAMLEYQRNRKGSEQESAAISKYQIKLSEQRSKIMAPGHFADAPRPAIMPDEGHDSFRAGIAYGELAGAGYGQINVRTSNHDELDPESGYALGAKSKMGDLYVRFNKQRVDFERIDLFGIFAPSVHAAWYSHPSVRFNMAIQRELLRDGMTPAALTMNAGGGYTFRATESGRLFALADSVVRFGNNHYASAGPTLGGIWALTPALKMEIESTAQWYATGEQQHATLYRVDAALASDVCDRQNSVRLNVSRQLMRNTLDTMRDFTDLRLTYFHYF